MKKILTIGGISLVLLTILGIGVFAKGDNVDCLNYNHNYHHEHNYQDCVNNNDKLANNHHQRHHNHNNHHQYNCE